MKYIYILLFILINICIYSKQIYMDILMQEQKIGWTNIQIDTVDNNIIVKENSNMKLNVYNNKINVIGQNFALYDIDMNLKKYIISIINEQMYFSSVGYVNNDTLYIETEIGNETYKDNFYIKDKIVIFNIELIDLNNTDNLYMFNPISNRLDFLEVENREKGKIIIGTPEIAYELFIENGEIYKIKSEEGIVMIKTDTLNEKLNFVDILNLFEIKAEGDFSNIKEADSAQYIIYNIDNFKWDNYRQKTEKNILTVYKKPLYIPNKLNSDNSIYTKPNKELKNVAKTLMEKYKDDEELLKAIMRYINKHIKQTIVSGLQSIEQIMNNREGDCTEYAQVFAALAKACGYNVDIVSGIMYHKGKFLYHAWNRVLIDNSVYTIDATFNQLEADVSHIQLSEGYPPQKVLIMEEYNKDIKIKRIK